MWAQMGAQKNRCADLPKVQVSQVGRTEGSQVSLSGKVRSGVVWWWCGPVRSGKDRNTTGIP